MTWGRNGSDLVFLPAWGAAGRCGHRPLRISRVRPDMRHDSPAAYRTPHLATPYRRGGLYGRPRATTRVAPTAFYEAERNLYLDLLHLVAASFRSLALPLTAKLAPSAASPLRAKPASLGSGPVQAAGTALHPDLLHRSVKKICLRQIFSVGRSGFAARRGLRRRQGYTSICSIR